MIRLLLILGLLLPCVASAQGLRVFGTTSVDHAQLRGLRVRTVPMSELPGEGFVREIEPGRFVQCDPGDSTCSWYESGEALDTTPLTQDLALSVWAPGGLRTMVRVRWREDLSGSGLEWPRHDDRMDVLDAYGEWAPRWGWIRAGRQAERSGLGHHRFDGLAASVRSGVFGAHGYGGVSLVRGLDEGLDGDALQGLDDLIPDERTWVVGGGLAARWTGGVSATADYRRRIRDDRLGLFSERIAADASARWRRWTLRGSLERDLSTQEWNELGAWLTTARWRGLQAETFFRHHHPFFELWTIWNAFSPVGYDEGGVTVRHRTPGGQGQTQASFRRRVYDETGTGLQFAPVRDDGWHASLATRWTWRGWDVQGRYAADIGNGQSRSDGSLRLGRRWDRVDAGIRAHGFDYIREFRIAGSTVLGLGIDARWRIVPDTIFSAGFTRYHHDEHASVGGVTWDQNRAYAQLSWVLGADPGRRQQP